MSIEDEVSCFSGYTSIIILQIYTIYYITLNYKAQEKYKNNISILRFLIGFAGALMGVIAAGLALCFMHLHWGLKKLWLRMGLHVRTACLSNLAVSANVVTCSLLQR